MPEPRCGTCRHYTDSDGYSGHCAIGAFMGRATAFSGETGCPGWSDGDDYARGWRDAVAAAVAECTDMAKRLQRNLTDDTPPKIADPLVDQACVAANLSHAIAALTPPG